MRAALIFALLLCSCAGPALTEAQCRSANWYDLGRSDALLGRQPQIDAYKKTCAPNESDYLAGWNIGYSEWNQRVSTRGGM